MSIPPKRSPMNSQQWKQNSIKTDESTIKNVSLRGSPPQSIASTSNSQPKLDLNRTDLVRLLGYLEGELQARDVVIATLKVDKAKQLLYAAKFGRLGLNDPLAALQRDSNTAHGDGGDFDEKIVAKIYDDQFAQLDELIGVQRKAHSKAKSLLSQAERRHAKTVRELEQERLRSAADAAQGDDVCAAVEKERERLAQQLEHERTEYANLHKELESSVDTFEKEKQRHKDIVMYLIQERRSLLVKLQEERERGKVAPQTSTSGREIQELQKQLASANSAMETMKYSLEQECATSSQLRSIVATQKEDLSAMRQSIVKQSKQVTHELRHQDATINSPRRSVDSNRLPPTSSSTTRGAAILTNPNFRDYGDAIESPVDVSSGSRSGSSGSNRTNPPPPYTSGRSRTTVPHGKTLPSPRTTSNSNDPHRTAYYVVNHADAVSSLDDMIHSLTRQQLLANQQQLLANQQQAVLANQQLTVRPVETSVRMRKPSPPQYGMTSEQSRASRVMKRRSTSLPRPGGKSDQSPSTTVNVDPRYATSGIPRPSTRSTKKHATQV